MYVGVGLAVTTVERLQALRRSSSSTVNDTSRRPARRPDPPRAGRARRSRPAPAPPRPPTSASRITSPLRVLTGDHRAPLPEGTIPVATALLIAGVATYAFFKVGTWAVGGADEFKTISSLWFATFALAPGFFLPLEQELGRALAHRRAIGEGGHPVVAKIVRLAAVLVALVLSRSWR